MNHSNKIFTMVRDDLYLMARVGRVYIVNGPPGCGKSRFVAEHRLSDDVIIDADLLMAALSGSYSDIYSHTKTSLSLYHVVRDAVLSRRESLILGGHNIWLIMSEPDSTVVDRFVDEYDAVLIQLSADLDTCVFNIDNDPDRHFTFEQNRALYRWFHFSKDADKSSVDFDKALSYYFSFKQFLDEKGIDYYITGSIVLYLKYNMNFDRPLHDIDIHLNESDVCKVKQYCHENNIKWYDAREDISVLQGFGHVCYFKPFEGSDFHIGFFLFDRASDGTYIYESHFKFQSLLHVVRCYLAPGSYVARMFRQTDDRCLDFNYALAWKLSHSRAKDLDDHLYYKNFAHSNYKNIILKIKHSFECVRYEVMCYGRDSDLKTVLQGVVPDSYSSVKLDVDGEL